MTKRVQWEYHVLMIQEFVNAKIITLEKNVIIAKNNFMVILIVTVNIFLKFQLFPSFKESSQLILACKCNTEGAKDNFCDVKTGQCFCNDHIVGDKCDKSEDGYYDFPNPKGIKK